MKVPLSWLRTYVDFGGDAAEIARTLVMAGVGIESIEGDVLDLEITANRADLLSLIGVAREIAALRGLTFKDPEAQYAPTGEDVTRQFAVEVAEPALCARYTARLVRGVKVGPSPAWMADRLQAAGIRPINNIVDVTNYVLLESGQPLHAFDASLLRGKKIVVRRAREGETLAAIDGVEYKLRPDMLVIADAERPVAIAGVMGGKETEITDRTTDVLLESAQFDPVSVRRTSRRLGLSSESSYRFERGVDFRTVDWASGRAMELIYQVAKGEIHKGVIDVQGHVPQAPESSVRPEYVARVLGLPMARERVIEILMGIGAHVVDRGHELRVRSPWRRRDLKIEADYIEEVARVEGYEKIPCDTTFAQRVAVDNPDDLVRADIRSTLSGLGGYEVLTWSFAEAGAPNRVSYWTEGAPLPLRDPDGKVDRTLRESLIPGFLQVLRTNEGYREELRTIYEIARLYLRKGDEYGEREVVAMAVPGDPLEVKGVVETLCRRLGVEAEFRAASFPFLEPGSGAEVVIGGRAAGFLGSPLPELACLRQEAGVAELEFEALAGASQRVRAYREFNRQPPVARDLSVVVADPVAWRDVEAAVRSGAPATLESVRFLSEYRGKGIEPGFKGWAFSMRFRAANRTMTGEEVEEAVQSILKSLEAGVGARLRQGPEMAKP